jgi:hypothetical protein
MVDMRAGLLRLHFPTHVHERGFLLQEKERVVVVMMMHVNAAVGLLMLCVAWSSAGRGLLPSTYLVLVLVKGKVVACFVCGIALRGGA